MPQRPPGELAEGDGEPVLIVEEVPGLGGAGVEQSGDMAELGVVRAPLGRLTLNVRLVSKPGLLPGGERATDRESGQEEEERRLGRLPTAPAFGPLQSADGPGGDRPAVEPGAQVVGQRLGRGVAAARVLLQALQADRLQVARAPRR